VRIRSWMRMALLGPFFLCRPVGAAALGPESQFFEADSVKIHYLRQGAGEPVVLIHGLYASAALNWQRPGIFAALAADHDVIALDLPGHGLSDKPDDAAAYGMQMVEDVVLLLDRLNIRRAHIIGYSLGGMVALKFMVEHPDRVRSGTLGGMGWLREGSGLQKIWEHMSGRAFSSTPGVCVSSIAKLALTEDELKAVQAPVEILIGDRDPVEKLYVAPLLSVRSDWPVIEIKGAGHITCVMKPQFTDELVKWINSNHGR
jgi:pimeloyl-ACP methyl ester carboxylesterase